MPTWISTIISNKVTVKCIVFNIAVNPSAQPFFELFLIGVLMRVSGYVPGKFATKASWSSGPFASKHKLLCNEIILLAFDK